MIAFEISSGIIGFVSGSTFTFSFDPVFGRYFGLEGSVEPNSRLKGEFLRGVCDEIWHGVFRSVEVSKWLSPSASTPKSHLGFMYESSSNPSQFPVEALLPASGVTGTSRLGKDPNSGDADRDGEVCWFRLAAD